ncbi:MAG: acyl-CoA dehydrogenase [Deltaproteobacteria bacterium HGW-Deltaproteobacteria-19]|jgi:isovaleryl-CoA dehydrogenase|nr:MAG: acyl-CoA dehydrogenase [Deltaproteobacteria bacterium HGW-Deltaproteobacteria-19]
MDFELKDEHRMLRESVAQFAARELKPIAEETDLEDKWPEGMWKKLGDLGVLGITIPPEYGGAGSDVLAGALVVEELARVIPAVSLSYGAHANLCMHNLYHNGNEAQRKKYLPPLCTGEHVGALGLTEPNAGSDAVSIQATARRDGDCYVVNGRKTFITNGPDARTIILYTKTDKAAGPKGITAFILDTTLPGFSVSRALHKVGNRGSRTGELLLEDCRIPAENVLGVENGGIAVMMRGLDVERAFLSTFALGIAEGAFAEAFKYAKERVQFGKPIASFQLIQAKLADMYTLIEASRLMCYKACILAGQAERGGKGTEVHKLAAAAILFTAEAADKVCTEAVQVHGGYGYCLEYPVQRFWRDSKLGTLGAGTSEMRRLIIARELLMS